MPFPEHRTLLPRYLAAAYALLIVYASLEPFAGWTKPGSETPFFLWVPQPNFSIFDVLINIVAYLPLGFFAALMRGRAATAVSVLALAVAVAGSLSFALEWTQMYLPSRVASIVDLASNTAGGALGALPALLLLRRPGWHRWFIAWRERLFMRGRAGDFGLALLAVWLLVQVNPAIPLFAATFSTKARLAADAAGTALEAAQTLFNVVGVGLLVGLLLRERRHIGGAVLVFVGAGVMLKGVAAALLLKRSFWEHWLGAGPMLGLLLGCVFLFALVRLPWRFQSVLCSVALLSALGTTLLAPDLLFIGAPLSQFSWSYGQLLNFNGLTHAALLVWPVVVSVFLFALAGRGGEIKRE